MNITKLNNLIVEQAFNQIILMEKPDFVPIIADLYYKDKLLIKQAFTTELGTNTVFFIQLHNLKNNSLEISSNNIFSKNTDNITQSSKIHEQIFEFEENIVLNNFILDFELYMGSNLSFSNYDKLPTYFIHNQHSIKFKRFTIELINIKKINDLIYD
jgi:hypothetical protein